MNLASIPLPCPVCGGPLSLGPARGRKSGKPSLMLKCIAKGQHLRAFITDQDYVGRVLDEWRRSQPPEPQP